MINTTRLLTVILSTILVTGCFQKYEAPLIPANEVLLQAAKVSQALESVAFNADARIEFGTERTGVTKGNISLSGRFHNTGEQTYLNGSSVFVSQEDKTPKGEVEGEVVFDGKQTSYFKFTKLSLAPSVAFVSQELLSNLRGKWWRMDVKNDESTLSVSPDPRLLRMQAEVVKVSDEHGVTTLNDKKVYHYSVEVDQDKFLQYAASTNDLSATEEADIRQFFEDTILKGEMYIDVTSFSIQKIEWNIMRRDTAEGEGILNVRIVADFSDQNSAEPIIPPKDAQVFSAPSLAQYGTVSPEAHSEDLLQFDSLSEDEQQLLINELIHGEDSQ